jgi:hypothetical protein
LRRSSGPGDGESGNKVLEDLLLMIKIVIQEIIDISGYEVK